MARARLLHAFEDISAGEAEDRDSMPLGFRTPLVVGVLPRALRGDGENGELERCSSLDAAPVGTNKPDNRY